MAPSVAPWWGVPVIAGGFLILGSVLTFIYTYINDRRKARIEIDRRFEGEIIELFEKIDAAIDDLHDNLPMKPDGSVDVDAHWNVWVKDFITLAKARLRLELIAPKSIYEVAQHIHETAAQMNPKGVDDFVMPELQELWEELRLEIRKYLRVRD